MIFKDNSLKYVSFKKIKKQNMLKCNWALVGKLGWTCSIGLGTSLTAWLSKELEMRLKSPAPNVRLLMQIRSLFWFNFDTKLEMMI